MSGPPSPLPAVTPDRVGAAYRQLADVDRPEVWIHLRPQHQVHADVDAVAARLTAGKDLPLAGLLVAVKDNIDVAGLPTTAGCPSFARTPRRSAAAVARLQDAGAVVLGKTNMDQFATGLVGTRSPYGAVRCAADPTRISGGSSSGSAVAVATGVVDVALGTDTAGSGRVPAAYQGLIGLKPTLGLVPCTGVVPASRSFDAVSIFARDLDTARRVFRVLVGPDAGDPLSRSWPADVRLALRQHPRIAVPRPEDLEALAPGYRAAFDRFVARVQALGMSVTTIDVSSLLDTARLLYDGALVAERHSAVGTFLDTSPTDADPTVKSLISRAGGLSAHHYVDDRERLDQTRTSLPVLLRDLDALVLPTTTEHPSITEVQADPLGLNRRLGTFTNFVNLLDLAAVAIPAGLVDSLPFGVQLITRAFDDQLGLDLAARLLDDETWPSRSAPALSEGVDLVVFGAHLLGQPLNIALQAMGARFLRRVMTSDAYALFALTSTPAKPGLVRVGSGRGQPIAGEKWRVSAASLGSFLATLPAPMTLGQVELSDGSWSVGFGCNQDAADRGIDISRHAGWTNHLLAQAEAEQGDP